jgi:molecular chaperone DnaK
MHVGIDLGTTFCCVAYVDDEGQARVIPSATGEPTTPSVIWFDGRQALVGRRANEKKLTSGDHVYEFVKRDVGRPIERSADDPDTPVAPYEIGGFKYGAAGMSAVILRKLKRDAVAFFRKQRLLDASVQEKDVQLDAVITVPAYFGERHRLETRLAGWAAGLNVIAIVNEPTAAALAYSLVRPANRRIMVFDLGGGTLDVTVLQMQDGEARVLSSVGNNQLGGRDWDAVIEGYILEAFRRRNGRAIPDDPTNAFAVQQIAVRSKLALSDEEQVEVLESIDDGALEETLYRTAPEGADLDSLDFDAEVDDAFYFDQRSSDLLSRCQRIVEKALEEQRLPSGEVRPLTWADIDEIVLAGGSCRMPMIPAMLERMAGRKVRRQVEGFNYDTAIAIGAALYGLHRARVTDVVSHGLGVEVLSARGRPMIDYLIAKDTPLPASARRTYAAPASARLEVYEGESTDPLEASRRGRLGLDNPAGHVTIEFRIDTDGILRVTASYPVGPDGGPAPSGAPAVHKGLEVRNEGFLSDARALALREKIQSLTIN